MIPRSPLPLWKRALDLAVCACLLPFLALAALAMTLVVKLASPGPVLFRQERIGCRGRRFRLYKFRTMHAGANSAVHQSHFAGLARSNAPMMKLDSRKDSRLIPGGWLLRATGLDELPQIINVLRGEMTMVGPRPCIPYEFDQYESWRRRRFEAVPGLTGLWQVSGKNRTTFDEMCRLDIRYAETKCLSVDLKIMLLTPAALLVQVLDTRFKRRMHEPAAAKPLPSEKHPQLT